eukprot:1155446-Pelagomonas_calceolata.AAC.4
MDDVGGGWVGGVGGRHLHAAHQRFQRQQKMHACLTYRACVACSQIPTFRVDPVQPECDRWCCQGASGGVDEENTSINKEVYFGDRGPCAA